MKLSGNVWELNGELVFCPFTILDFRLGRPNENWIKENGGKIMNLEEYDNLKEGDEVEVNNLMYFQGYEEYDKLFSPYLFGCRIFNIKNL